MTIRFRRRIVRSNTLIQRVRREVELVGKSRVRPKREMLDVDAVLARGDAERAAAQRQHDEAARYARSSTYGGYYDYGYPRSTSAVSRQPTTETARPFQRPAVQGTGKYKSARERKAAQAAQAARGKAKSGKKSGASSSQGAQTRTGYRTARQQRRAAPATA